MNNCDHIKFTSSNYMNVSTLGSSVEPVTNLDWLKNEFAARQVKWTDLSSTSFEITAALDQSFDSRRMVSYVAIPSTNLPLGATVEIKVRPFENNALDEVVKTFTLGQLKGLGIWRAGIDLYGSVDGVRTNNSSTTVNQTPKVRNNGGIFWWLDEAILATQIVVTVNHNYSYVAPTDPPPVVTSDGIFRQNGSGVLSIEAENAIAIAEGADNWVSQADVDASNDTAMYKSGAPFYWVPLEGPKLEFEFTASQSGLHKIWIRMKSTDGNSIYTTFDGTSKTTIIQSGLIGQGWQWFNTMSATLTAEAKHKIVLSARDHYLSIDKIQVLPAGAAAPTGEGDAESGFGSITTYSSGTVLTSADNVAIRMLMYGEALELDETISYGSAISFLTEPKLERTFSGKAVSVESQNENRIIRLNLDMMTDLDRARLIKMERDLLGQPFVVSAYPNGDGPWLEDDFTFLGKFANAINYQHTFQNIHKAQLTIVEV